MTKNPKTEIGDKARVSVLPKSVYEGFGGFEKAERELLILSWMQGGVAFNERRINTRQGQVVVPKGAVWGSVPTMKRHIFRSVGCELTKRQLRYTIGKLEDSYLEDSMLALPDTNGKYGKIYHLPDAFIEGQFIPVNNLYRMFAYGNVEEFRMAEKVIGDLESGYVKRGNYSNADMFTRWVAKEGLNEPAFTNLGRWRAGEERQYNAPVFIPWITVDIDSADLVEALKDAKQIVEVLEVEGYDMGRVFVSFSGRKGFHIQVSTSQVGSPIFENTEAAQTYIKAFTEDVSEGVDWDPAVTSPHSLIRISGSKHSDTGLYKTTWRASEFKELSAKNVFSQVREHKSVDFSDEAESIEQEAREHFIKVAEGAKQKLEEYRSDAQEDGSGDGVIARIKPGLTEGQIFGEKSFHVGRENGAFILSCWFIERYSMRMAWRRIVEWNNRNDPPLPRSRLETQFKGAKRKLNISV